MSNSVPPIMVVGGGKMGEALTRAWQERSLGDVTVIEPDPERADYLRQSLNIKVYQQPKMRQHKVIVLAVKPLVGRDILKEYRHFAANTPCLCISLMAGCPLSVLQQGLGDHFGLVRVMPNIPVVVGKGVSVGYAVPALGPTQREWVETLFSAVGDFLWTENEENLHAVTALSGSGPAYVFFLTEILTEAAISLGMDAGMAEKLARATVIGSGELLRCSKETASLLRHSVTSPGGTTQAALDYLSDDDRLATLFTRALKQAAQRSRDIQQNLEP